MNSSVDSLITLLCNGIAQRRIYFGDHPRVAACSQSFTQKLNEQLAEEGKALIFLGMVEGKLVYEGRYLLGASIIGRKVVEFIQTLRSGGLLFRAGVSSREVTELFGLAADKQIRIETLEEARTCLANKSVGNIELSPTYEDKDWYGHQGNKCSDPWRGESAGDGSGVESLIPVYQSLFDTVDTAHARAGGGHELDVNDTRSISENLLKSAKGNLMDIMQLVYYPDFDSYTVGHSVRVAMLAVIVGQHLGMPQQFLLELGTAGLLHDVGKAKIPDEILFKPGRLSLEERKVMESHPVLGAKILMENRDASQLAISAAWGHHLRFDQRGYPPSPCWSVRSEVTALLHICDVFEALTAVRPYKAAISPRRAYEIMIGDQGAFHPSLLRTFVSAMGIYPPGSQVLLSTGEQGLVIAAGEKIDKPQVRLTNDAEGGILSGEDARTLDLSSHDSLGVSVASFLMSGSDPVVDSDESAPSQAPEPARR